MATHLAGAAPAVRAALAEAAGEATGVDPALLQRLAHDSDPRVRQVAERAPGWRPPRGPRCGS
jgi:hypothetical protein